MYCQMLEQIAMYCQMLEQIAMYCQIIKLVYTPCGNVTKAIFNRIITFNSTRLGFL